MRQSLTMMSGATLTNPASKFPILLAQVCSGHSQGSAGGLFQGLRRCTELWRADLKGAWE